MAGTGGKLSVPMLLHLIGSCVGSSACGCCRCHSPRALLQSFEPVQWAHMSLNGLCKIQALDFNNQEVFTHKHVKARHLPLQQIR